jgi:hypothetical protein
LLTSICIPLSVRVLCQHCFDGCGSLSRVTFQSGSRLLAIHSHVFRGCSSLRSICIPRSVEILSQMCFSECRSLSIVTFESRSHLRDIEYSAFCGCTSLMSIRIPSSLGDWLVGKWYYLEIPEVQYRVGKCCPC